MHEGAGEESATPLLDQATFPVGEEPVTLAVHVKVGAPASFEGEQVTDVLVIPGGLLTVGQPGGEPDWTWLGRQVTGVAMSEEEVPYETDGITPFGAIALTLTHCQNS